MTAEEIFRDGAMFSKAPILASMALSLLPVVLSCGSEPSAVPEVELGEQVEASEPRKSAVTPSVPLIAPITPDSSSGSLPPGHPPIRAGLPTLPSGSGAGTKGLVWIVPEGWIEEIPSSNMRRAQYRVPGRGGDGECVVFYFGPGQGGDTMSNAARWAGQFEQPDGRPSTEVMKTEKLEVAVPVLRVEVTGTYANMMIMDEKRPGYMLLGAIAEGPDANWFFKFTGPEVTLLDGREGFDEMIRSLRVGE